jgi:maltose O-acetyltransferase
VIPQLKRSLSRYALLLYTNLRVRFYRFLSNQDLPKKVFVQPVVAIGAGTIKIEYGVRIGYWPSPHFLSTISYIEARNATSIISIGENTRISNGFVAIAENGRIAIGRHCLIGARCEIYDSDFHALSAIDRMSGHGNSCYDVEIGDWVFMGSNVRVLKGVTIGTGSVIANSAVVTRDIPPNCVAAGVPAKVIRNLPQ